MVKGVYQMKDIINHEGLLKISENGQIVRVKFKANRTYNSKKLPYVLKPSLDKDGYERITIQNGGNKKIYYVHRLVALNYIPNPNNYPVVNHIDGNKRNNHYTNLEWCTITHNNNHALKTGLRDMKNNKLSKPVLQYDMKGNFIKEYASANEARRQTGLSQGHISECCRNEIKQYRGYIWKYKVK